MKKIFLTAAILMGFATGSYTYADDDTGLYLPTHGITTNWDAEVQPGALTPNSVTFSSSTATVNVDDKVMLTAIVNPTGDSDWAVTWTVGGKNADAVKLYSDADCNHEVGTGVTTVLTVYAKGLTEGEATVTATSHDAPSLSATCTVTVAAPAATVSADFEDGNMPAGWDASHANNTWYVATEDYYGYAPAYSGTYSLYVDGNGAYDSDYFVSPALVFDGSAASLSFAYATPAWEGDHNDLSVCYGTSPNGPWNYTSFVWVNSSSWTTATVDLSSLNGTYYIAFESYDGYGYCTAIDNINITGAVPAAPTTYTVTLKEGTDDATNWTITPAEATTTGVAAGTEVKATYGGTKKVKSVKAVKKASAVLVTAITLNKTATTISAGQTETLSVSSVTPDDATDQTVTWSSDNDAVATVDADGKVTAVAFGTANITATANDGSGVTATCAVTVSKVVTINQSDWGDARSSFTKDGVTVSAGDIDPYDGNLTDGGTFSTTLGNFTKIEVTAEDVFVSGTGWSGSTWTGNASSVSFSGSIYGYGEGTTKFVFTIVPKN